MIDRRRREHDVLSFENGRVAEFVVDGEEEIRASEERTGEGIAAENAARVKRARHDELVIARDHAREPVIVGEVGVQDVEAVPANHCVDGVDGAHERERVLCFLDERMREVVASDLRLQFVSADIRVVRVHARRAERIDLGECRRGRAGPPISGGQMQDFHSVGSAVCPLL
jgi:hypothetical protein